MTELNKFINKLPGGDGWYSADNENDFRLCAKIMLDSGMGETQIQLILTSLYQAVASEFGA